MVRQRPAPLALDRCMAASHHGHRRKSRIRCVVRVWSARAGRALRVICAHTRVYTEARIAVVLGAADGCDYGYAVCVRPCKRAGVDRAWLPHRAGMQDT